MSCKKCKKLTFITDYESWLDYSDGTIMCPTCYEPMEKICYLMSDDELGPFDEELDMLMKVLKELDDKKLIEFRTKVELIIEKYESFGLYMESKCQNLLDDPNNDTLWFNFYLSILNYKPENDTYEDPTDPLRVIADRFAELIETDLKAFKAYTDNDTLASLKTNLFNILKNSY